MPSFLIFDSSVCRGMPSLTAAPVGPPTTPSDSLRAASRISLSCSTRSATSGAVVLASLGVTCVSQVSSTKKVSPFRQNHRTLDYILQLADVARPIVCVEELDRLLVYVSNLLAQFFGVAVDQVSDQQGNIANALAQCRQSNRKNVEAVKQILTKPDLRHR